MHTRALPVIRYCTYQLFACVVLLLCGFRWPLGIGELTWERVNDVIAADYPRIMHLGPENLLRWLEEGKPLLLVDVREFEEYQISHISGAVHIASFESMASDNMGNSIPIIAYCSVGIRSAKFVSDLQKRGFNTVYNLRGSLFEWANKGLELVGPDGQTENVHPYNERWGKLLNSNLHQYPE